MTDKKPNTTVIVGAQWGDEGKGKITDFFASRSDYIIRFQGGNNAGHTVIANGQTYKLHLIPSGVLYPKAISVIGNGVVVDPKVLLTEIEQLKKDGIEPNLKISNRSHVIMPYHIAMDEGLSAFQGELSAGSTKRGIAPVCADKHYRHGIRIGDLLEPELLDEKLKTAYNFNKQILEKVFNIPFSATLEEISEQYLEYGRQLKKYIDDVDLILHQGMKEGKKFLFEGAQGLSLDVDFGVYPHTTSTNTIAGHINVGSGVCFNEKKEIIGVAKAYVSRVGISPFVTELEGEEANFLRDKGGEYGTTTGRPRRVGWLDIPQLKQAVRLNGLTQIAITKLDVLEGFEKIKVCIGYRIDNQTVEEIPASLQAIRKAKPVYETLEGWPNSNEEERAQMIKNGFDSLPENMKKYIKFIEEKTDCPVKIISLGPKREETITKDSNQ